MYKSEFHYHEIIIDNDDTHSFMHTHPIIESPHDHAATCGKGTIEVTKEI